MHEFIEYILEWLKKSDVSRQELADEAGYNKTYLNDLLCGSKPVTKKADKAFRLAIKRIDSKNDLDLSKISVAPSPQLLRDLKNTAKMLGMSVDEFIDMILEKAAKKNHGGE